MRSVISGSRGVLNAVALVGLAVGTLGALALVVVGFWDFLVWLFKADWQTTHGRVPLYGVIVGVVGLLVGRAAGAMRDLMKDVEAWLKRHPGALSEVERALATYDTPDEKGQTNVPP